MNSVNSNSGSKVGCAAFGTPAGREVISAAGVSVALDEDWVAQAPSAMLFDPTIDTVVLRRIQIQTTTVLWFGIYRRAYEINFNRDGGYVGFCIWMMNRSVNGAKLLRALSMGAEQVRTLTLTDEKFHSSINAIAGRLTGDPDSYSVMLASTQDLPSPPVRSNSSNQRPMVLDLQGCSDDWLAQFIDLFQTEPGLQGVDSLALTRSTRVLESARSLRQWAVVRPVDFLMGSQRTLNQTRQGQLQEALTLAEQRGQEVASMQRLQNELVNTQYQARTFESDLMQARERIEEIERKAKADEEFAKGEIAKLRNSTSSAEQRVRESEVQVTRLQAQVAGSRQIRTDAPSPEPWMSKPAPDLSQVEKYLEKIRDLEANIENGSTAYRDLQKLNRSLEAENEFLQSKVMKLENGHSSPINSQDSIYDEELNDDAQKNGNENDKGLLPVEVPSKFATVWHVFLGVGWVGFIVVLLVYFFNSTSVQELQVQVKKASQRSLDLEQQIRTLEDQRYLAEGRIHQISNDYELLRAAIAQHSVVTIAEKSAKPTARPIPPKNNADVESINKKDTVSSGGGIRTTTNSLNGKVNVPEKSASDTAQD